MTVLGNISDIIALADGTDPASVEGLNFEPGRLLYHQLEFCSLAHTCAVSDPRVAMIIRESFTLHQTERHTL